MTRFGGLTGVMMGEGPVDLGEGVILRSTYAHLFAPFMAAFSPPRPDSRLKIHGGPVKAAKGGMAFDILVELEVPLGIGKQWGMDEHDVIRLVASLLRLSAFPYMSVSAVSDISFNDIPKVDREPVIRPFETEHRMFSAPKEKLPELDSENLAWLREVWKSTAELMKSDVRFQQAFRAFDSVSAQGRISSSLLSVWGAIEHLFSPNTGELRYRVSANMATFLTDRGPDQLKLFKELSALYADRSTAAHTAKDIEHSPLVSSYVHLRNALVKIVDRGKVPTQGELEEMLFL